MKLVRDRIEKWCWNPIGHHLKTRFGNQAWNQVWEQIGGQVRTQVAIGTINRLREEKMK